MWVLTARGVVVWAALIQEHGGDDPWIEVEFTTAAGETVRADTSLYRLPDGAFHLDVVYDPQDPGRMQGADPGPDYILPGL